MKKPVFSPSTQDIIKSIQLGQIDARMIVHSPSGVRY